MLLPRNHRPAGAKVVPVRVSAIIPARDEAPNIAPLLHHLRGLRDAKTLLCEIIVCDGGSKDDTVSLARAHGATVVEAARGRGPQMNAGARVSTGTVLWFLHADARPHALSLREIRRARQNGCIGGNFRLCFAARGVWPRGFELVARVQRCCGVAYGDSGFWCERDTFELLGGYRAWPLFEDYDFWRRLNALGRVHPSRLPVRVSARRIETRPAQVLALWLKMQAKYWRGVPVEELAREYHAEK